MKSPQIVALMGVLASLAAVKAVNPADFDGEFRSVAANCQKAVWIRAGFHDAGTFVANGDGGANGSLEKELGRGENRGLQETIDFYRGLVDRHGFSMADAVAYGTKVAIEECGGPQIAFTPGRVDAQSADPEGRLPSAFASAQDIIEQFQGRLGMSMEELVAVIGGAHSAANIHREVSGLSSGPMDTTPLTIDSRWFREMLARDPAPGTSRVPADFTMSNHPDMRPIFERFAEDNDAMRAAFRSGIEKMLELGAVRGNANSNGQNGSSNGQNANSNGQNSQNGDGQNSQNGDQNGSNEGNGQNSNSNESGNETPNNDRGVITASSGSAQNATPPPPAPPMAALVGSAQHPSGETKEQQQAREAAQHAKDKAEQQAREAAQHAKDKAEQQAREAAHHAEVRVKQLSREAAEHGKPVTQSVTDSIHAAVQWLCNVVSPGGSA